MMSHHYEEARQMKMLEEYHMMEEENPEANSEEVQEKESSDSMEMEYMMQQSEGVSILGDNYEADRLIFYSDHSVGHGLKDEFDLI